MTDGASRLLEFWGVEYLPEAAVANLNRRLGRTSGASVGGESLVGLDAGTKASMLEEMRGSMAVCKACPLGETRTNVVFGEGSASAEIVFVGEAPGFEEDRTGHPFVGRAGKLLTDIIEKGMGLTRDDIYICNVLKCRPPNNRAPIPSEVEACSPYLFRQLQIIRPKVIIALGAPAAQTLLQTKDSIGRLRGRFHDFYLGVDDVSEPIQLMPTYHPAYLLRSPGEKIKVWEDIKLVLKLLGLGIPGKKK